LLAYRHTLLRQALRTVLAASPDIATVVEATNGQEAVTLAAMHRPDVVLMDAQLPVVSGVEATELIKGQGRGARVLLLTLGADEELVIEMLRAGASGCVLVDADVNELVTAVRVAAGGGSYLSHELQERLVRSYSTRPGQEGDFNRRRTYLSPRELEVLRLAAEGTGNSEIARRLVLSVKTVEAHKANICQKLGVRGSAGLIKYAIRKGLIDLEAAPERAAHPTVPASPQPQPGCRRRHRLTAVYPR
jgi:two-component system response regulator NreC